MHGNRLETCYESRTDLGAVTQTNQATPRKTRSGAQVNWQEETSIRRHHEEQNQRHMQELYSKPVDSPEINDSQILRLGQPSTEPILVASVAERGFIRLDPAARGKHQTEIKVAAVRR
jgi:hypothetical protein